MKIVNETNFGKLAFSLTIAFMSIFLAAFAFAAQPEVEWFSFNASESKGKSQVVFKIDANSMDFKDWAKLDIFFLLSVIGKGLEESFPCPADPFPFVDASGKTEMISSGFKSCTYSPANLSGQYQITGCSKKELEEYFDQWKSKVEAVKNVMHEKIIAKQKLMQTQTKSIMKISLDLTSVTDSEAATKLTNEIIESLKKRFNFIFSVSIPMEIIESGKIQISFPGAINDKNLQFFLNKGHLRLVPVQEKDFFVPLPPDAPKGETVVLNYFMKNQTPLCLKIARKDYENPVLSNEDVDNFFIKLINDEKICLYLELNKSGFEKLQAFSSKQAGTEIAFALDNVVLSSFMVAGMVESPVLAITTDKENLLSLAAFCSNALPVKLTVLAPEK